MMVRPVPLFFSLTSIYERGPDPTRFMAMAFLLVMSFLSGACSAGKFQPTGYFQWVRNHPTETRQVWRQIRKTGRLRLVAHGPHAGALRDRLEGEKLRPIEGLSAGLWLESSSLVTQLKLRGPVYIKGEKESTRTLVVVNARVNDREDFGRLLTEFFRRLDKLATEKPFKKSPTKKEKPAPGATKPPPPVDSAPEPADEEFGEEIEYGQPVSPD